MTHPLETVCISLLDLVVALTKFLLVFIFSLEETPAHLLSFMTALSESFCLMSIHNALSWPISTLLLFSQIGKSVLDSCHEREQAGADVSSKEKTNTKEDLARVTTKSRSKMQTVTHGHVSQKVTNLVSSKHPNIRDLI